MWESGLILDFLTLSLTAGTAIFLQPFCTLYLMIFTGAAAGFFVGVFEPPEEKTPTLQKGAAAGAVRGGGALLGSLSEPWSTASSSAQKGLLGFWK